MSDLLTTDLLTARAVIEAMADVAHQAAIRCANEAAGFDPLLERRWAAIARAIESALESVHREPRWPT